MKIFLFLHSYFRLMYVISSTHETRKTYTYDCNAEEEVEKYHDEQQKFLQENHLNDSFMTSK